MSATNVAEETKADVEAVKSVDKSVEDASYPTTASRELSHTKPSFAADADRGPGERAFYAFGKNVVGKRPWLVLLVVAALFAALTTGLFVASKTRPSSTSATPESARTRPSTRRGRTLGP
jgi:hypothetical protein